QAQPQQRSLLPSRDQRTLQPVALSGGARRDAAVPRAARKAPRRAQRPLAGCPPAALPLARLRPRPPCMARARRARRALVRALGVVARHAAQGLQPLLLVGSAALHALRGTALPQVGGARRAEVARGEGRMSPRLSAYG